MKLIPKWATSLIKKPTFWCYAEIKNCKHMFIDGRPNCIKQCEDCKEIQPQKQLPNKQLKLF